MGRKRTTNHDLPPRMHRKGDAYYHVTSSVPRKWTCLGSSLPQAKLRWAELEMAGSDERTFEAMADRYINECISDKSASWQRDSKNRSSTLVKVFGKMNIAEIKPHHVAEYLDKHPSKASANQHIVLMGVMYQMAMRWGWTDFNPTKGVRKNSLKVRDRYITDDEYMAIRSNSPDWMQAMMDLSYLTGMRISDILKLRLADIQTDGLYVQQKKTGKKQVFEITPDLQSVIDFARSIEKPVQSLLLFSGRAGRPIGYYAVQYQWDKACELAHVKDAHFHDLRAKSGTDAKRNGIDYQALLGHTKRDMSDRYVKAREADRVIPNKKL